MGKNRIVLLALAMALVPCQVLAQVIGGIPINPGTSSSVTIGPKVIQSCKSSVAAGTSATCTLGTAPAVGDRLIIGVAFATGGGNVITPPSGFTALPGGTDTTESGAGLELFYQGVNTGAPTAYATTQSQSGNMTVIMVDIQNASTMIASTVHNTSQTSLTTGTIVPQGHQALPLAFFSWSGNQTSTPQAGWTEWGPQGISSGPSSSLQTGPLVNPPGAYSGSITWNSAPNGESGAIVMIGSSFSPPFRFYDTNGVVGSPMVEKVNVSNVSWTCTSGSLCLIGTYTFQAPWPAAPTCNLSVNGTSAANTGFIPVVQGVSTTTLTVYGYATEAFSTATANVKGLCYTT